MDHGIKSVSKDPAHIFLFIIIGYYTAKLHMISYHGLECVGFKVAGLLVHQFAPLASFPTSSKVGLRLGVSLLMDFTTPLISMKCL